jgi:hypothetical protein
MEGPSPLSKSEAEPPFVVAPPAVESLLNPAAPGSPWPEEIRTNPALEAAAEKRRALIASLDEVYAAVPDPTLELGRALARGLVSPEQLTRMYGNLAELLEDPENRRAALYLPFETIPPAGWEPEESAELAAAVSRFSAAYADRWWELVSFIDPRANFAEGDLPESDMISGGLPEVVKAAHLAPKLVEKGIITVSQIIQLARDNAGTTLEASLADAAPLIIRDADLAPLERAELEALVERVPTPPAPVVAVSPNRRAWLEREKESRARRIEADALSAKILHGEASPASVRDFAAAGDDRAAAIAVAAIGSAIESAAAESAGRAQSLLEVYAPVIEQLALGGEAETLDAVAGAWSRLVALGVAEGYRVGAYEVPPPMVDAGFSEAASRLEGDLAKVDAALAAAKADPRLEGVIASAAVFSGSRLRGYGTSRSDFDTALFVQPEVSRATGPLISSAAAEDFRAAGIDDKPLLFWLEADGDQLMVGKAAVLGSTDLGMASMLFGAAWVGEKKTVEDTHARLLSWYLHNGTAEDRRRWLEDMERSALQYRLMHRGYSRFFPPRGGLGAGAPKGLDPQSTFWDSGFRRLATKTFARKVFLPKLG